MKHLCANREKASGGEQGEEAFVRREHIWKGPRQARAWLVPRSFAFHLWVLDLI